MEKKERFLAEQASRPIRKWEHIIAEEEWARLPGWKRYFVRRCFSRLALGKERRKVWKDSIMLYLFWCEKCASPAKDYEHGYRESENGSYLTCSNCGTRVGFVPFGLIPTLADTTLSAIEWVTTRWFKKSGKEIPGKEISQDP